MFLCKVTAPLEVQRLYTFGFRLFTEASYDGHLQRASKQRHAYITFLSRDAK